MEQKTTRNAYIQQQTHTQNIENIINEKNCNKEILNEKQNQSNVEIEKAKKHTRRKTRQMQQQWKQNELWKQASEHIITYTKYKMV